MIKHLFSVFFLVSTFSPTASAKGSVDNWECLIKYAGQAKAKRVKGVQCATAGNARIKWIQTSSKPQKVKTQIITSNVRSNLPRVCRPQQKRIQSMIQNLKNHRGFFSQTTSDCVAKATKKVFATVDKKQSITPRVGYKPFLQIMDSIAIEASLICGCDIKSPRRDQQIKDTLICLMRAPRLFDRAKSIHQATAYVLSKSNFLKSKNCTQ